LNIKYKEKNYKQRGDSHFLRFNARQRFAAWRSGGFLAQKFNRRTALEPTTKLSYEAMNPPLRQTAVMGWLFIVQILI
jgi:hypothetical protein